MISFLEGQIIIIEKELIVLKTSDGVGYSVNILSQLASNLKLEDFIAEDGEDYIKKALLIKNGNKINELYRKEFREKALKSCLFDTETFAKDFTKLIRSL